MTAKISVSKIRIDGGTQPRCEINQQVVSDYAEAFKAGEKLPAIVVFFDGCHYWLADGFHRFYAAQQAGMKEIECQVERGICRMAILYSVGANVTHGLRRTNLDRRKAVETLLKDEEWGVWSDNSIAAKCVVSNHLVADVRASLTGNSPSEKGKLPESVERTYKTKHGTTSTMKTEKISAANKNRTETKPETKPEAKPEPVETKEAPATDECDQIIPEHLIPAFDNGQDIAILSRKVSAMKGDIEALAKLPGGESLDSCRTEIELARKNFFGLISDNRPYSVCGLCHGDKGKSKSCKACKGKGWLPEHVYKKLPDANRKGGKNAPATVSAGGG